MSAPYDIWHDREGSGRSCCNNARPRLAPELRRQLITMLEVASTQKEVTEQSERSLPNTPVLPTPPERNDPMVQQTEGDCRKR